MVKRIVLLFASLLFASLCWGQYSTAYQTGVTDITSSLPTVNTWHAFPQGGICPSSLTIGTDGFIMCIGGDGYVYSTTPGSTSPWTKVTGMGNQVTQVGIQNSTHVYVLGPFGVCYQQGPASRGIKLWNGSSYSAVGGCLTQMSVASDGTLAGTNTIYPGLAWITTNGGSSWTQIAGGSYGPNLNYVSAAGATSVCGTNGTQIFLSTGNGFIALPAQPASSGIAGCVMTSEGDSMYAWGTFGVKRFDFKAGTWGVVSGLSGVLGMTSGRKGATLALDSAGHPKHLNVYAGFVSGTTSGVYNNCPTQQCGTSILHHGTLQVTFPHGLAGAAGSQFVNSNQNLNVSSFDYSATCDPTFGDPSDPECQGLGTGSVICGATGTNFTPSGPGNPPRAGSHFSEWVGSYSGNYVIDKTWQVQGPTSILYNAIVSCGTYDTCMPPTFSVCSPPRIDGIAVQYGAEYGPGASQPGAIQDAVNGCKKHSLTGGDPGGIGPGAWGFYSVYDMTSGGPVCYATVGFDATPYLSACY